MSEQEVQDLKQRVFRLEDHHHNIIASINKHSTEAREATARIHKRIDEVERDTLAIKTQLSSNTTTLHGIKDAVQPLEDIGKTFRLIRQILLYIAAPAGAVFTIIQAMQILELW